MLPTMPIQLAIDVELASLRALAPDESSGGLTINRDYFSLVLSDTAADDVSVMRRHRR